MKTLKISILVLGLIFLIGCGSQEQQEELPAIEYSTETIKLETLRCQMCVATVQMAIAEVEGIYDVNVDLTAKMATVSFDPDITTLSEIENSIAKAGYHANETTRDEDAYAKLPDCCR
jgi:copper chaperone CopZ